MTIQINPHNLQAQRPFANVASDAARGPQRPEEPSVSLSPRNTEDRATFSQEAQHSLAASAPSAPAAGENPAMGGLPSMPSPENLAAAHSPISYERVMQLLE